MSGCTRLGFVAVFRFRVLALFCNVSCVFRISVLEAFGTLACLGLALFGFKGFRA